MYVVYVLVACPCVPSMYESPECSISVCDTGSLPADVAPSLSAGFVNTVVCVLGGGTLGVYPGTNGYGQLCVWPAIRANISGSGRGCRGVYNMGLPPGSLPEGPGCDQLWWVVME